MYFYPSGSTAYNKSLNGAILDFNVNALQLALIAPFETINSRIISPLVLSKENEITFKPKINTLILHTIEFLLAKKI